MRPVLLLAILSMASSPVALADPSVRPEFGSYVVAPDGSFELRVLFDPDDTDFPGLFSHGTSVNFDPANAVVTTTADITIPAVIAFNAVLDASPGHAGAKGTAQLPDLYQQGLLATVRVTNKAPAGASYPLQLSRFVTAGPQEDVFVTLADGSPVTLDDDIFFGGAVVTVAAPAPALPGAAGHAILAIALILLAWRSFPPPPRRGRPR